MGEIYDIVTRLLNPTYTVDDENTMWEAARVIEGLRNRSAWQDISAAPKDGTPVIIAVPTKDKDDFIVGEASFDGEHDGWWWAGNSWGDYYGGPISEINHQLPTHWMPLPPHPTPSTEKERAAS